MTSTPAVEGTIQAILDAKVAATRSKDAAGATASFAEDAVVFDVVDPLAYHGVEIDVAPTRHGVTRGYTTYFFDPVGNRNELFTGGYWVDPDFEPITWTEEEMGRAIFYYDRQVNERFFTVHS